MTTITRSSIMKAIVIAYMMMASGQIVAQQVSYGSYQGSGGMTAYKIEPNVYEYHYDNGFTGPDAMGWDPDLQHAWSRIAAASVCGVPVDKEKALTLLETKYQQDKKTQEIIGVGFHQVQIAANPKFCTNSRVEALALDIADIESGVAKEQVE